MPSEALKRRRADVRKRLAAGETVSAISRYHGVDRATIIRDRAWLAARDPRIGPPAPAEGNARAVTHGATSKKQIDALVPEMRAVILTHFPWLDDVRCSLLATVMAQHESGSRWLGYQPEGVVRNDQGDVWPIADRLDKWSTRILRVWGDLKAEGQARATQTQSLEDYLASSIEDDDTPPEAETAPSITEDA